MKTKLIYPFIFLVLSLSILGCSKYLTKRDYTIDEFVEKYSKDESFSNDNMDKIFEITGIVSEMRGDIVYMGKINKKYLAVFRLTYDSKTEKLSKDISELMAMEEVMLEEDKNFKQSVIAMTIRGKYKGNMFMMHDFDACEILGYTIK